MDQPVNRTELTREYSLIERASKESKNFYSAGSSFTTLSCGAVVHIAWDAIDNFHPFLANNLFGLFLCVLIVFAYALILPEPPGYENEGKMRLTASEIIFGLFNTLIVFAIVMGFR